MRLPGQALPVSSLHSDVALPVKHPHLAGAAPSPPIWLRSLSHVNTENAISLGVCDFVLLYKIWTSVLTSSLLLAISRLMLKGQILFPVSSDYRGIEPYAKDLQGETHTAHIPAVFSHVALGAPWKRGTLFPHGNSHRLLNHFWLWCSVQSLICSVYEVPA